MQVHLPSWRNWQTRMVQVHVLARVWGFESLRWHQEAVGSGQLILSYMESFCPLSFRKRLQPLRNLLFARDTCAASQQQVPRFARNDKDFEESKRLRRVKSLASH